MALICNRHPFEYAENVCSSCGIAFCHDCLVYPRGPKKPPLCVPCAIAAAGVRSSARNHSNLSRREVKKRVRDAKGLQQPQPYVEAPATSTDRDFELTSNASFDQGWAVSWDEGRDPHPGYPEPVHVSWGNDPFAGPGANTDEPTAAPPTAAPPTAAPPAPAAVAPIAAPAPIAAAPPAPERPAPRPPELPRLQAVVAERAPARPASRLQPPAAGAPPAAPPAAPELAKGHAPARPGGLPSVRPPLKPAGGDHAKTSLPPLARAPMPTQQPRVFGGAPATRPEAAAPAPTPPPSTGRLRRKEADPGEGAEMLGWLDDLLGTEKDKSDRA